MGICGNSPAFPERWKILEHEIRSNVVYIEEFEPDNGIVDNIMLGSDKKAAEHGIDDMDKTTDSFARRLLQHVIGTNCNLGIKTIVIGDGEEVAGLPDTCSPENLFLYRVPLQYLRTHPGIFMHFGGTWVFFDHHDGESGREKIPDKCRDHVTGTRYDNMGIEEPE
jgi:hypothetical protein